MRTTVDGVDVYATGVLSDLQVIGRSLDPTWPLRYRGTTPLPRATRGWRRQAFCWGLRRLRVSWRRPKAWHGYHAEPLVLPPGLRRIGSGWTRRRALRSLARYTAEAAR
jgi:hypothetical protein